MRVRGRPAARCWLGGFAATVAAVAMVTTGCQAGADTGSEGAAPGGKQATPSPTQTTPRASIEVTPADGTQDVAPDAEVSVRATGGTLTEVVVTAGGDPAEAVVENASDTSGDDGGDDSGAASVVEGTFGTEKKTWSSDERLLHDTEYHVVAVAVDPLGRSTKVTKSFRTLTADTVLGTYITPDDQTVGVGHPIVVEFTTEVADEAKAGVVEALTVETSKPVKGAWRWMEDDVLHYRPKNYWPAYTDVTIRLDLLGVSGGEGVWGIRNKVKEFSVGRSVISKVDLDEHTQKVYIDGELARTIEITAGKPGWETRSGVKVILEKRTDMMMRSESIGISDKDSPDYYEAFAQYALRVTWSGEFHHSADWSVWAQGEQNVSHGCVGMNIPDSRWLWEQSQIGDVVEVTGSDKPMDIYGNGYGDWNLSWAEWKQG